MIDGMTECFFNFKMLLQWLSEMRHERSSVIFSLGPRDTNSKKKLNISFDRGKQCPPFIFPDKRKCRIICSTYQNNVFIHTEGLQHVSVALKVQIDLHFVVGLLFETLKRNLHFNIKEHFKRRRINFPGLGYKRSKAEKVSRCPEKKNHLIFWVGDLGKTL